jgi:transcriptional regulator
MAATVRGGVASSLGCLGDLGQSWQLWYVGGRAAAGGRRWVLPSSGEAAMLRGFDAVLVHPWDAPLDDAEWRAWLGDGHDFGELIIPGLGRDLPVVVPTHFVYDGDRTVRLHLARPNPAWDALAERPRVLLTVIGDYAYVPAEWGAAPGTPPELGIPTSYYATVQLSCDVRIADPAETLAILGVQLSHFEPGGGYLPPDPDHDHYRRRLPAIRGLVLTVTSVRAKFKYGGNKTAGHREILADRLAARGGPADPAARAHLLRRNAAAGSPVPPTR